jgi:NAD(P)-dependent dehydrogenase (short-subunit alcohol dehydrogenase family)
MARARRVGEHVSAVRINREFPMRNRLNVVVTGAASGLGRVVTEQFSRAGHSVFACDVAGDGIQNLASTGLATAAMTVDVSNQEQLDAWFRSILTAVETVDVLINNVGVAGPHANVENVAVRDWQHTFDANLNAAFHAIRHVLPGMKRERFGSIINVSTASVRTVPEGRTPYVVSKAALEALTIAVAREVGPFNIRCNAVRPGMMNNERLTRILERVAAQSGVTAQEVEQEQLRYIWLRKKVEMSEVADAIMFLASAAAASITGQIIGVDGGMHWES